MRITTLVVAGFLAVLACLGHSLAVAIPPGTNISGYLTDADGNPINGQFPAQARIYADSKGKTLVATLETHVTVTYGYFNGPLLLTGDILLMDEVWYRFAIDLDRDGVDESDYFDELYQISSVPFSLTGKPITFFETHGGTSARGTGMTSWGALLKPPHTAHITPFTTPPAGVVFNRIGARVGVEVESKAMVGIYDWNGDLVYSSPIFSGGAMLRVWEIEGALEPSRIYYTALWSDNWPGVSVRANTQAPSVPTSGVLYVAGNDDGLLPVLAFDNINPDIEFYPTSLALYNVDETSPAKMRAHDGPGINHKKKREEAKRLAASTGEESAP